MGSRELLNCDKFEDRIHQILDDRLTLTGDDLLMDHASYCAKCERVLNAYDCVDASLKLLPTNFADIPDHHSENRRGEVRNRAIASRPVLILASLAALIVITMNAFHGLSDPSDGISRHASTSVAPASQLGFASPIAKSKLDSGSAVIRRHRPAPDTSPFSPNFSVANSIPTMNLPSVPTWEDISDRFNPLEPVLTYSARIPAVHPVYCSLNATIDFLRRSFSKSDQEREPDLGFAIDPDMLARV